MSRFLHVEFNITLCRAKAVLQIGENIKVNIIFLPGVMQFCKQ